jgi:hypothetical protein
MRRALSAILILTLAACSKQVPPSPPTGATATPAAPEAAKAEDLRLSGPHTHGNLSIYLIHNAAAPKEDVDCLTLEEALKSGALKVTEKAGGAEVNELQVENVGDKPVYLQAGDTVKGGQQDRTIAIDTMLPPKSGKRGIDAFCVEPGRWHAREGKSAMVFGVAKAPVATNAQKLAIRLEKDQGKVWAAGEQVNRDLATLSKPAAPAEPDARPSEPRAQAYSSSAGISGRLGGKNSYVEAVEDEAVQKKLADRIAALETTPGHHEDIVGVVFCMNGKVQSAEIYAAAGLFRKLWPKLLRSAAVEAISKQKEGEAAPAPSEADVRAMLAAPADAVGKSEVRADGQTVRIYEKEKAVRFDTEEKGKLLHRQVLAK